MKTSYKPSKLPAIAAQVRKEHPTSSEIKNYQLDNSFLDEVRQWAKLPKEDVDGEAITICIWTGCGGQNEKHLRVPWNTHSISLPPCENVLSMR